MNKCIKCGSYAFNLYKENIDQGGLCDVHYWQGRANRAEAMAAIKQDLTTEPAQQALDKMAENARELGLDYGAKSDHRLMEMPAQQEPVAHSIVAGALFDFMGWLTSRNECLVLSSTDDAAPAADAIKDFAHMRNLSIDDAKVREWQEHLASPPASKTEQQEPVAKVCHDLDGHIGWNPKLTQLPDEGTPIYTSPQASKPWVGLSKDEIYDMYNEPRSDAEMVEFARAIEAKLMEKNNGN